MVEACNHSGPLRCIENLDETQNNPMLAKPFLANDATDRTSKLRHGGVDTLGSKDLNFAQLAQLAQASGDHTVLLNSFIFSIEKAYTLQIHLILDTVCYLITCVGP